MKPLSTQLAEHYEATWDSIKVAMGMPLEVDAARAFLGDVAIAGLFYDFDPVDVIIGANLECTSALLGEERRKALGATTDVCPEDEPLILAIRVAHAAWEREVGDTWRESFGPGFADELFEQMKVMKARAIDYHRAQTNVREQQREH